MKPNPIPMLPAKNFVFPVLRPLLTMLKCMKAMLSFDDGAAPPVVLKRESLSNACFLTEALAELCKRAGIEGKACKPIADALKSPGLWNRHPVDTTAFQRLVKALETFCVKHKTALGEAYRQDKDTFNKLYKANVLKRKVLVIHSEQDAPDTVVKNLSSGSYYDVDTVPISAAFEKSAKHHVTVFLCTDADEATEFFLKGRNLGVDIFLSDLGRKLPALNMSLCRLINQAQRDGVKFIPPPYVTMKLLPSVEEAYVRHLESFDRAIAEQEDAMSREEDALFQGMEEAVLYAELILEAHWRKSAAFSMEKSFLESEA